MQYIFSHSRLISFILVLIFTIFLAFSLAVIPAEAFVLVDDIAFVVIIGAILLTGGITFASMQDMQIACGDFMSKFPTIQEMVAPIVASDIYIRQGIIELGESWREGWGYFWDAAKEYFGTNGAVNPGVNIPLDSIVVDSSGSILPIYTLTDSNIDLNHPWKPLIIPSLEFKNDVMYRLYYSSLEYIEFYGECKAFLNADGTSYWREFVYCKNYTASTFELVDLYTFNSSIPTSYAVINCQMTKCAFTGLAFSATSSCSSVNHNYSNVVGALNPSICPDWDIPDTNIPCDVQIEKGNDALLEDAGIVIDADFIKSRFEKEIKDIVGDVVGDITGVLVPDIPIDWSQSDIIKDTVLDTDKPMPTPTPRPTSSPSPSPAPSAKPDFPINKLPPGIPTKFPFSLPWDIYYLVQKMQAEPIPPKFVIPIDLPSVQYYEEWVFDIGKFESVAVVVRWGMTLLFVLGLVMITRKLVK